MPQFVSRRESARSSMQGAPESASRANLYERAASLLPMGAWSCDLATEELTWTDGVFDLFGFPRTNRIDRREAVSRYGEESREMLDRLRSQAIASCGVFSMDAQIIRPDGEERWMRLTGATHVSCGRAVELYGMKQDITADRALSAKMQRPADPDTLSGLANRARFEAEFLDCSVGSSTLAHLGALLLIDLKNLKASNNSRGHGATDGCIGIFGHRLAAAFPNAAMIARIGGAQFAVLLPKGRSKIALGALVYNRVAGLLAPISWQGESIAIGASVGMAFADHPRLFDPDAMLAAANTALRQSKCEGNDLLRYAVAETPGATRRV